MLTVWVGRVGVAADDGSGAIPPGPGAVSTIQGEWWTPGFRSRVNIRDCAGLVCADIVWLWDPRVAPIGQQVLYDLRADPDQVWRGGRAFNPADGKTYKASARLLDADRLIIEGCVLFLCQEQVWLRVGSLDKIPRAVPR